MSRFQIPLEMIEPDGPEPLYFPALFIKSSSAARKVQKPSAAPQIRQRKADVGHPFNYPTQANRWLEWATRPAQKSGVGQKA
jgi:hypothetical protein